MDSKEKLEKFWKNKKVFITGHTGFKGSWMSILLNMLEADIFGYSLKPNKESLFNQANCKNFVKKNFYGNINNSKDLEVLVATNSAGKVNNIEELLNNFDYSLSGKYINVSNLDFNLNHKINFKLKNFNKI